jgi:hypothetical protein
MFDRRTHLLVQFVHRPAIIDSGQLVTASLTASTPPWVRSRPLQLLLTRLMLHLRSRSHLNGNIRSDVYTTVTLYTIAISHNCRANIHDFVDQPVCPERNVPMYRLAEH